MTPQELKNSILQRAIQGRLVEQRPEEGTGAELYREIQAEKQRLIRAGKIKKEKPLPEITEDEIPFDIPESWKWVRIGSITFINPRNDISDTLEVSFVPMTNISDGYNNQYTSETRAWKEIKKGFSHFAEGDIGVAKITPCFQNRKSVIFHNLKNGYGAGTTEITIIRTYSSLTIPEYLLSFFKSGQFISNGIKSFTGTAGQQRIHKDYIKTCLFPLPPLAEQRRIVAKIEELLPYLDRYTEAWNRLETFNKRFPSDMRKSLLQLAIQGRLVEQRPEEGTGEELYRAIQTEKRRRIQAGELKREKPLPEIAEDEIPFEIPESWMWVRLASVLDKLVDGTHRTPQYTAEGVPFVSVRDISSGKLDLTKTKFISEAEHKLLCERCKPEKNDILLSKVGTTGIPAIVDTDEQFSLFVSVALLKFNVDLLDINFLMFALLTPDVQKQCRIHTRGVGNKNWVIKDISNTFFPLPPFAEQRRIVARLEELLPLCDGLK